jgi:hypothetical protein
MPLFAVFSGVKPKAFCLLFQAVYRAVVTSPLAVALAVGIHHVCTPVAVVMVKSVHELLLAANVCVGCVAPFNVVIKPGTPLSLPNAYDGIQSGFGYSWFDAMALVTIAAL